MVTDSCKIPLSNGGVALIDCDDLHIVEGRRWRLKGRRSPAVASSFLSNGKVKTVLLHREIMQPPDGLVVDHINGDVRDNRRVNLRVCTNVENGRNRTRRNSNNKSGYTGVVWIKSAGKWQSQINCMGKTYYLGCFLCPIEAALARDVAAIDLYGEYAGLNFPDLHKAFTHQGKDSASSEHQASGESPGG